MNMNDAAHSPPTLESLHAEMQSWRTILRVALVLPMAVPLYYATWVLIHAPAMRGIIEDMLGSTQKLSVMCKYILSSPMVVLAVMWGVAACACGFVFVSRKPGMALAAAAVALLGLVVGLNVITAAVMEPFTLIIQGLAGGTP